MRVGIAIGHRVSRDSLAPGCVTAVRTQWRIGGTKLFTITSALDHNIQLNVTRDPSRPVDTRLR